MNEEVPKPEDFGINPEGYKKLQEKMACLRKECELGKKETDSNRNWTFWLLSIAITWFLVEKFGFPSDIGVFPALLGLLGFLFLSLYFGAILFSIIDSCLGSLLFTSERGKQAKKVLDELELKYKERIAPFELAVEEYYKRKLEDLGECISRQDPNVEEFDRLIVNIKKVLDEAKIFSEHSIGDTGFPVGSLRNKYEVYSFANNCITDEYKETRKKEHALSMQKTGETHVAPPLTFNKTDSVKDAETSEQIPTPIIEKKDLAENTETVAEDSVKEAEPEKASVPASHQPSFFAKIRKSLSGGRFKKSGCDNVPSFEKSNGVLRKTDWEKIMRGRMSTGATGEEVVMLFEKEYLSSVQRNDLAERVRHVSRDGGDGFGYDIASFFPDGKEKYIEVKATKSSFDVPYYISRNELGFLRGNAENSFVYRVLISETDTPEVEMIPAADILENSELIPINYMVKGK